MASLDPRGTDPYHASWAMISGFAPPHPRRRGLAGFIFSIFSLFSLLSLIALAGALTFHATVSRAQPTPTPPPLANFTDVAEKAGLGMMNVFGGIESKKYI